MEYFWSGSLGAPLYSDPCRECGFSWAAGQAGSISLICSLPDSIDELVADATGTKRLPDLGWNVSGYVAHMTDNTRIWAERLVAVARGADPHVVPYDPDSPSPGTTTTWRFRERSGRFASQLRLGEAPQMRPFPLGSSCCTQYAAQRNCPMSSRQTLTTPSTTAGI
jgi:hypothetical protein